MKIIFYLLLLKLVSTFQYAQSLENTFTIQDQYELTKMYNPSFSPDGMRICYELGSSSNLKNRRIWNIWISSLDSSNRINLTNSTESCWNSQWSPDGRHIAFMSSKSGKNQVYIISPDGGVPKRITSHLQGIKNFKWINNSFISFTTIDKRDSLTVNDEIESGGAFFVDTQSRTSSLWIQSILDSTNKKLICGGKYYISDFSSSSDASQFALIISEKSNLYDRIVNSKVIVINQEGIEKFSFSKSNTYSTISFSPDDKHVAFFGSTIGFSSANSLFVINTESGKHYNLTEKFDPTIRYYQWFNNESIVFNTPRNIYSGLYTVSLQSEIDTLLSPYWVIDYFSVASNSNDIAFIGSRGDTPPRLFTVKSKQDPSFANELLSTNSEINKKQIAPTKSIKYYNKSNQQIEAILTLPLEYSAKKIYPLIVKPHGGPDVIDMDRFSYSNQFFAANGYIVFQPNFRGSIGYGSEFYASNRGKIHEVAYEDIISGVDYLIEHFPVDTTRMMLGGWSFGGSIVNWIIGHTDRFTAAVSIAGISNTLSRYGKTDINYGKIAEWEYLSTPVLNPDNYEQSSPLYYLKNCNTPTLLIHGEIDSRVPISQSWETYRALKDLGVDVKFVIYPNAGHGINSFVQHVDVYEKWINMYKKY